MLERIKQYIKEHNLFTMQDNIVCGVSGGIDSMTMCNLLIECGYKVSIAHCNFSLRDAEADLDEELVRQFAAKKGVRFHVVKFQTKQYAAENNLSTQMAARDLRYAWFEKLCKENSYTKIAIAHNANDSIETFFINLMRGTGVNGLGGIVGVNDKVVRPLLFAFRKEIEEYAEISNIKYRTDSSNLHDHYLRNWIRLDLLPKIVDRQSTFLPIMLSNIDHITSHNSLVKQLIAKVASEVVDGNVIDIARIKTYGADSIELLYELIKQWGFAAKDAASIMRSNQSGKIFFSENYEALLDREKLIIRKITIEENNLPIVIDSPQTIEGVVSVEICGYESDYKNAPKDVAYLDGDSATFPLTLRRWRDGDKFSPLGVNGEKKVSDFLIDIKSTMFEKEHQMVVESRYLVAWLVGKRISEKFKITPTTKKIIKISYLCKEPKEKLNK
ncbi:MAG: tRNA lysidine(34) synthetase TilS [Rikenellaceae bacterium]